MNRLLLIASLLTASVVWAQAKSIEGKAINVADGDTITILDASNAHIKVRIIGIDAPEKKQAFGERSRHNMVRMVAGKQVTAHCNKVDRYGRQVCQVWVQPSDCPTCGRTLDVGHAQILMGLAWWYRQYAKEQSAEAQGRYESAEHEARLRKHGLWADDSPIPPWDWRKGKS